MAKEIKAGQAARNSAVESLVQISDIVSETVGPAGRPILLARQTSATSAAVFHTKDGITVLRELNYTDPIADAVHKISIQATADTVMASGDGTTSTLIMAAAFAKALKYSEDNNPQAAMRKFRAEVNAAVKAIEKEVVKGEGAEAAVALTSTNGDVELTKYVREAISQTSAFGTVLVEKNPLSKEKFTVDKEFGYQAGTGYSYNINLGISVSDCAVTNGEFFLENCHVLPYNGNVTQIEQLVPALEKLYASSQNFSLLVVCYEVSDEVCNQIIVANRKNPGVKIFVSRTTPTAEVGGPWNQLNDIAAFSGATIMDGGLISRWDVSDAGLVKKVRIGPYRTFVSGKSDNNWIVRRAEQNAQAAELASTPLDRDIINSRNASLTGGLVKLIVGGGLPGDIHEIADRADDSIKASQACRRSGCLPGCGLSYIRAGRLAGVSEVVQSALSSVHERIVENYGCIPLTSPGPGITMAISENEIKFGQFLELGVADSFETIKSVMLNGFSLGALIANIGGYCLNADLDEIQKQLMLKNVMLS